ncbi:MAG TPA: PAS domain S-box protein, partial [Spirochaetales bacterium]|nr:PAS domain S-box protein [Spirochaetales bacterium]
MVSTGSRRILLVEDQAVIALNERRLLESLGYEVAMAYSGEQAIEAFKADGSIAMAVMDIDLGDGIDGTEAAGEMLKAREVPVVFMSSHAEADIVEKTERVSSYGYIEKNSGPKFVAATLRMAFRLFEARSSMQEANRRLEATLEALPDLLFELDEDGRYLAVHCNDPGSLYAPIDGVIGTSVRDRLPPEAAETVLAALAEAKAGGLSRGRRYDLAFPEGRRSFELSVSRMATGRSRRKFVMICRDITKQAKVEDELRRSKRQAERLLGISAQIIQVVDLDGVVTVLNDSGHRLLGYEPPELIGQRWVDRCVPDESRPGVEAYLSSLFRSGADGIQPHENDVVTKDGRRLRIHWQNSLLRADDGRVVGVLSSGEDVTEYRELEERYRTIVEASPDNITVTDLQGRMLMFSPKARTMFGVEDGEDRIGCLVTDFMAPEDRPRAAANIGRMLAGEPLGAEQYTGLRADGSTFDMEINGAIIRDGDGRPKRILFVVRDITARNRLVGKYRILFDQSPLGIGLFDFCTERFVDANPALQRMTGYGLDELRSMTFLDVTAPEDFERSRELVSLLGERGTLGPYEKLYRRKDGALMPVSINAVKFDDYDGRPVVWGIIEDITVRRAAERRVESLLAEKDLILKEVHHRLKNNFAVIRGLLGLQADSMTDPSAAEAFLATEARVQSMALLYEKLYESSRFSEASMADYLPSLVREVVANYAHAADVRVETDAADVRLDVKRLQALGILVNELVSNSMKHAFKGRASGLVFLRAGLEGGRVTVTVGDDGPGMPEPPPSDASGGGFGLTLVSLLATQLRADIARESDGGTVVRLSFE